MIPSLAVQIERLARDHKVDADYKEHRKQILRRSIKKATAARGKRVKAKK